MVTRSGLGAVIATVILAVLGLLWNYEELMITAVALGIVVALAILIAQRPLRATVDRRLTAVRVQRGDPLLLTHHVSNNTRHRSSRATVIDRCGDADVEVPIKSVEAGAFATYTSALITRRRGVYDLGPMEIRKIDPFSLAIGTWTHEQSNDRRQRITVHPKVYSLVGPNGESRVIENESILRHAATDPLSGFVSMRDYVAGDDPRLIHWPTTARMGTLMIRENVEVRRPEFTVVVDTGAGVASSSDFEEMVDVAASVAVQAQRSGLDVVVRTTDRLHTGQRGALHSEGQVLDLLTNVNQTSDANLLSIAALFANGYDHTTVMLVTGPMGPTSRAAATSRMTTIRIGHGAEAADDISFAAEDAVEFATKWRPRWT